MKIGLGKTLLQLPR